MEPFVIVDQFCGAGGATLAAVQAAAAHGIPPSRLSITGANHNPVAIATHQKNFPGHVTYCQTMQSLCPKMATPGGRVHLSMGGAPCPHFSNAAGGVPRSEQERVHAWEFIRWCEQVDVDNVLIENVPEFQSWGPLDAAGRPIKGGLGAEFARFIGAFHKLGYNVEWRVLCAADYGDATSRRRLFIQARRGKITWPVPTHYAPEVAAMNGCLPWRTAREIIDWTLPGQSIFNRKKRLVDTTMDRIWAGMERYWPSPFLVGVGGPRSLHKPIPIDEPLRTLLGENHLAVVQPFLVHFKGTSDRAIRQAKSVDQPLPTVCAQAGHLGLIQPFLIQYHGGARWERTQSLDMPVGTLDTSNRYGLVQPFLISYYGNGGSHSVDHPVPTITSRDRFGLVEGITDGLHLDITLRMLQTHELAAAHSFPDTYQFVGNQGEVVKQIGNSWPVRMGAAVIGEIMKDWRVA